MSIFPFIEIHHRCSYTKTIFALEICLHLIKAKTTLISKSSYWLHETLKMNKNQAKQSIFRYDNDQTYLYRRKIGFIMHAQRWQIIAIFQSPWHSIFCCSLNTLMCNVFRIWPHLCFRLKNQHSWARTSTHKITT